jgi:hypothetical protein
MRTLSALFVFVFSSSVVFAQLRPDGATASFRGSLPPKPTTPLDKAQISKLKQRLAEAEKEFAAVKAHARAADADIFIKAVRYAIEFDEWYDKKAEDGFRKGEALLDEASSRIAGLKSNKTKWLDGPGLKVVGFYSKIDDSPQAYGVEIPVDLKYGKGKPTVPMWVWLHGRGDTSTDLHFIYSRLTAKKYGQFQPSGTIVIHPFGRYCNGYKSAGEIDVLESRDDAVARFNVDPDRVVIAGFSMGGAGAWHLGAHFTDQWAVVHTGAGFVDVKRYQKLTPEKFPPWYEQTLWGTYDVPNYARNFLNVPLICYSGEKDKQRDSAEYMIEILAKENFKPLHFIGPGVEHKYHPETIEEVQAAIEKAVTKGRNTHPEKIAFQTRTLAYNRLHWLEVRGLKNHWEEARVDASLNSASNSLEITATNVSALALHLPNVATAKINGQPAPFRKSQSDTWAWSESGRSTSALEKQPGLQGPIDDAFRSRFLVVVPNRTADENAVNRWVDTELQHFLMRWRSLMRGDPLVKKPQDVSKQDIENCHLILWGTPKTNSAIEKVLTSDSLNEVLVWNEKNVGIGKDIFSVESHVPALIYPNPMNPKKYVVLNSGLTFREAHDRTNSLQNPKLPDWAIVDISEPPSLEAAGKIVDADFFDEGWKIKSNSKSPDER